MEITIVEAALEKIDPFRALFLQELNAQFIFDSYHRRGRTRSYLLSRANQEIGYGSLYGDSKDCVFEFYIIPAWRNRSDLFFLEFLRVSGALTMISQTNDHLLTRLIFQTGEGIQIERILFGDDHVTTLFVDGVKFRPRVENDIIFEHKAEPVGDYVLEKDGQVLATGGFLKHYNLPFADLYMEVREDSRRQGLGSLLIQELKKQCYLSGRVPAARCDLHNQASKATLLRAGFRIAGFVLNARINSNS